MTKEKCGTNGCVRARGHLALPGRYSCSREVIRSEVAKATKRKLESITMQMTRTIHSISWCWDLELVCGHKVTRPLGRSENPPKQVICRECFPK